MHTHTQTHELHPFLDAPTAPHCESCGETLTPDGKCFSLGTCVIADEQASRGASQTPSLGRAVRPAAWTLGGRVD